MSPFSSQVSLGDDVRVRSGNQISFYFLVERLYRVTLNRYLNVCIGRLMSNFDHISFSLCLIGRSLGMECLVQTVMNEVPEIIMQCVSRDEAALAIAQKVNASRE